MAEALINKLRGHYRICLYTGLRLTSFMLQLLLALGSGHGRGRPAAAAAAAAVTPELQARLASPGELHAG